MINFNANELADGQGTQYCCISLGASAVADQEIRPLRGAAMIVSRIDRRGRTTIPRRVREALNLSPGTALAYSAKAGSMHIAKCASNAGDPFGMSSEWNSEADTSAYADL